MRRRRRFRQARRGAYALALVASGVLLIFRHNPPTDVRPTTPKPYTLVQTRPLRHTALVETKVLPADSVVMSIPMTAVLTTAAAGEPSHEINDADLLALAPNPAVLVRRDGAPAELVFVTSVNE